MLCEAVVLAGGFGSRLEKIIGKNLPKPMALISNRPLLEWILMSLKDNGIKSVLLLLHHHHDVIQDYFKDGKAYGLNITYSIEEKPRGTAGAIFDNLHLLQDQFYIIYGDTFFDIDLNSFKKFKKKDDQMISFIHPSSHPEDSDLVKINTENKITKIFRLKNETSEYHRNLTNAALYFTEKSAFKSKNLLSNGIVDISKDLIPKLIDDNQSIRGYISSEYIKDMGTPKRYETVNNHTSKGIHKLLSKKVKRKCIFLDRDGIINFERGHLSDIDQFSLRPEIIEILKCINNSGFLSIVVTNQPVIARGELDIKGLTNIHNKMEMELGFKNVYLDAIYYCPHHPDSGYEGEVKELKIDCDCRKPKPGLINQAVQDFNIDVNSSWLIGDNIRDVEAAIAAGVNPILLNEGNKIDISDIKYDVRISNSLSSIYNFIGEKLDYF